MTLIFNIYSKILLVSGIAALLIAIIIFGRVGRRTVQWFGFVMVCISIWAITYGLELSSQTLEQMLFWIRLEYIGIALLPPIWLVFMITFIGKEKWLSKLSLSLIFLIPVLTVLFVWTNQRHHLHYSSVSLDNSGKFPLLDIHFGIWYKIFTTYYYVTLALGCYLLGYKFSKSNTLYKKQNSSILIGTFIPWIVNAFYLLGFRPYQHIDLTPFAFIGTGLFVSFGLIRFRLLDIIPIAREKIIEALQDGMLVLDVRNRIIDMNDEMKNIFPSSMTPVISKSLTQLFPSETQLLYFVAERIDGSIELASTHDAKRFIEVEITSIFKKNKTYSGVILLFRDITEQKKDSIQLTEQSQQLEAINQLKDRLFSIISHDLRAPLHSLLDVLNTKDADMLTKAELKLLLPKLSKNISYTSDLLENLLYWSKNQLKGEHCSPVVFDFKIISEDELNYFEQKAEEKGIRIESKILPHTLVFADKHMIRLVLRNLLSNAVKFCRTDNKIVISSRTNELNEIVICVEDSGTGIQDEVIDKLFKLETFTTRGTDDEQGIGLGLLICKEFIEKNKGSIHVDSKWGSGSKFYFTLPKADAKSFFLHQNIS